MLEECADGIAMLCMYLMSILEENAIALPKGGKKSHSDRDAFPKETTECTVVSQQVLMQNGTQRFLWCRWSNFKRLIPTRQLHLTFQMDDVETW